MNSGAFLKVRFPLLLFAVGLALFGLHLYRLGDLPCGLHWDEAAIGYAAHLIRTTLRDEHGVFLPLYFRSLGDFKSPLYIYATVPVLAVLPLSPFSVRLTAAFCHGGLLLVLVLALRRLFRHSAPGPRRWATMIALVAAGTLPWHFVVSRLAYETVTQPVLFLFTIYLVHRAFEPESGAGSRSVLLRAALAGLVAGLCLYTYATGRLLAFLTPMVVLCLYARRATWRPGLAFVAGFAGSVAPFFSAGLRQGRFMMDRAAAMSYVFRADMEWGEKLFRFARGYTSYFTPKYLFWFGDTHMRHGIGDAGQMYYVVALLGLVGVVAAARLLPRRFFLLLLCLLFAAPLGGALTYGLHQTLRGILFPTFLLVFVAAGVIGLYERAPARLRQAAMILIMCALVFEANRFFNKYFSIYPARSAFAMESWGLEPLFARALEQGPGAIYIVTDGPEYSFAPHASYLRARYGVDLPVRVIAVSRGEPGSCELKFQSSANRLARVMINPEGCSPANYQLDLACFPARIPGPQPEK